MYTVLKSYTKCLKNFIYVFAVTDFSQSLKQIGLYIGLALIFYINHRGRIHKTI